MKTVTVVAEDRVGLLADISYILGKSNVNIDALTVDVVGKKAIISLTVKDPKNASGVLEKNGFKTTQMDSIVIKLPNRPGEINRLADRLNDEKVSIENMHILSTDMTGGVFALNVDKPRKAVRLLNDFIISADNSNMGY